MAAIKLISILMPVKNADPFLKECMQSIIAQSEQHWELIAVDDHSSDDSFDILSEFARNDNRIKVLKNTGDGIIDALRMAFEHSQGNFITRMDADDKMAIEKLERLKRLLLNSGPGHIATGLVKYFSNDTLGNGYKRYEQWLNQLSLSNNNFSQIYKECVIPSPCWMLHKTDLEICGAFNNNTYPEDYDLCFRFYENNLKVVSSDKVLHFWRDHPTRSSRTQEHYQQQNYFDLKLPYFLKLEFDNDRDLFLLGAGDKGKSLAKKLIEENVPFHWTTDNPKKIGQDIYGKILVEQTEILKSNKALVIVAISSPDEVNAVQMLLENNGLELGSGYYLFC